MYQEERMEAILRHLKQHQRMSIQEMCRQFNISRDTARRDTVRLAEQGMVVRTHGGVMLSAVKETLKGYGERLERASTEKRDIAVEAASRIKQDETIMLDASTTVQFTAEQITTFPLTVITNSVENAERLPYQMETDIYLLGGRLHPEHRFLYGPGTLEKLGGYYADRAFIGVIGVCEDGFYYAHEEDAAVKQKMADRAGKVYVLADHTKFYKKHFYRGMELAEADAVITDILPPPEMQKVLQEHGVELITAGQR
ncbi:DeoR/GlpR family DNA-binding transcription regulator [Salibacterium qingdaonense]|uniref:Transcriptional regulator, DeoR family n=1 Tax=Salibacterium qingdaonense TaxID=266892 RepID=A0A1I4MK56_9BACI|nr:DeoR/GlpR family DNA-binding transcription regulator [Salibacterium qingdaonense]SFM03407.1 transcriptional regulator, DeoR family [Salibacterium qingdaonense]